MCRSRSVRRRASARLREIASKENPALLTEGEQVRHAINIGSVGKPKDNDPRGCYVLLNIADDVNSIKVEFVRFLYDIETAAKAVEESPLPNEYAEMLRKGV